MRGRTDGTDTGKGKNIGGLVTYFERNGFVFDRSIRTMENSGIMLPTLRQRGIGLEFLTSGVWIGVGHDVVKLSGKASPKTYRLLLFRRFPDNARDVAAIIAKMERVRGHMDVLHDIDDPLFLDLKNALPYLFKTILLWLLRYIMYDAEGFQAVNPGGRVLGPLHRQSRPHRYDKPALLQEYATVLLSIIFRSPGACRTHERPQEFSGKKQGNEGDSWPAVDPGLIFCCASRSRRTATALAILFWHSSCPLAKTLANQFPPCLPEPEKTVENVLIVRRTLHPTQEPVLACM